jgi:hypothetical protein
MNNNLDTPLLLNHLSSIHASAMSWGELNKHYLNMIQISSSFPLGRMARWEKKERIGDLVALVGQFVAVGRLAGSVYDGQDIKSNWDLEHHASFALIKQSEVEAFEDVWLYNR